MNSLTLPNWLQIIPEKMLNQRERALRLEDLNRTFLSHQLTALDIGVSVEICDALAMDHKRDFPVRNIFSDYLLVGGNKMFRTELLTEFFAVSIDRYYIN